MENNRKDLDRVDELLESTSEDKRLKFNFSEVETIKGPEIEDSVSSLYSANADFTEPEIEEPAPSVVAVEPIAEPVIEEPQAPVESEPVQANQQKICIIDETSTSIVIEQGPDISMNELSFGAANSEKKAKAPKGPLKLKPIQIVIMAVAGLIALWVLTYTVDHTLAANGISPIFCHQTEAFEDGSASYKGLGYKVQFKFDANGNLTQKVLPAWQDGPNDIVELPE